LVDERTGPPLAPPSQGGEAHTDSFDNGVKFVQVILTMGDFHVVPLVKEDHRGSIVSTLELTDSLDTASSLQVLVDSRCFLMKPLPANLFTVYSRRSTGNPRGDANRTGFLRCRRAVSKPA
jgi:hypothetical protein